MLIKCIILAIIGVTAGIAVAAGVFAFISMIGVINRLASRTGTANSIYLYESCIIWGGTIGNILVVFQLNIPLGTIGLIVFGVFSGIFVGCLAMALAESLKVMPIFAKRIKLTQGIPYIVLSIAIGKGLGSLYQLFFCYKP